MPHCCSVKGFDDVARSVRPDWLAGNFGTPGGEAPIWFQGNTGIFDAQAGAADSYVASNYLSAGFGGNVDNWLVTPLIFGRLTGTVVTFSTRTAGGLPGDNLELLYNNVGSNNSRTSSRSASSRVRLIRPTGKPSTSRMAARTRNVRFAFRYTVTDTSVNGDYIGIDSLSVSVPEPGRCCCWVRASC